MDTALTYLLGRGSCHEGQGGGSYLTITWPLMLFQLPWTLHMARLPDPSKELTLQ